MTRKIVIIAALIMALMAGNAQAFSGEIILIAGDTLYSYLGGTLSDYFKYRPNDFLKIEVMICLL